MDNPNRTKEQIIASMNQHRPTFLRLLGCEIVDVDLEKGICEMYFDVNEQFCHSVNIIQGGFVTAMLDAVSAHATFALTSESIKLSSLELKVSFMGASFMGKYKAIGKVEKLTRNFAFVSAELFNEEGERTATLSSTAKISYPK